VRDLAAPGTLSGLSSLRFIFPRAALEHETYSGANARVRYLARASVVRSGYTNAPVTRDADFVVRTLRPRAQPAPDSSVRLEVGIEDCLHIEFAYDRTVLGLTGVLTGHVDFLLVRVRIKNAEVSLVRREQAGPPGSAVTDNETLSRFEIMDGAPIKGERIPIRMYLGGLDVGPTQSAVGNVLSVKYFLNLVLVDEEDRRYFKQAELKLVREIAS
jgi:vacuolar protein sorting-associated protein 26